MQLELMKCTGVLRVKNHYFGFSYTPMFVFQGKEYVNSFAESERGSNFCLGFVLLTFAGEPEFVHDEYSIYGKKELKVLSKYATQSKKIAWHQTRAMLKTDFIEGADAVYRAYLLDRKNNPQYYTHYEDYES